MNILYIVMSTMSNKLECAFKNKQFDLIKSWYKSCKNSHTNVKYMRYAARYGCLSMIEWLYERGASYNNSAPIAAVMSGHIHVVEWFHVHKHKFAYTTVNLAALYGHLHIVKILDKYYQEYAECATDDIEWGDALNYAALHDHGEIVGYIVNNHYDYCASDWAMISAAKNGYTDMMRFLSIYEDLFVRHDDILRNAMDHAVLNNQLKSIKLLYQWDVTANTFNISIAAERNYIDIVKFLHCRNVPFRKHTRELVVKNGHAAMAQWMQDNMQKSKK